MDEKSVRLLIRKLLLSGRLPYDSPLKVSGSPAAGEVCARVWNRHGVRTARELVMEATIKKAKGAHPIQSTFSA
jgi:hypothetical protein